MSGVCWVCLVVCCVMAGAGYSGECVRILGVIDVLHVGVCFPECVCLDEGVVVVLVVVVVVFVLVGVVVVLGVVVVVVNVCGGGCVWWWL